MVDISTNVVILGGVMVRTPFMNQTRDGGQMAKFSIDVNRRFVDRDGKRRKDRVVCVAFHNAAQGAAALSAGDLVVVKGELQEDNKKDPNTQEWRKSYSVVCESVSAFRPNDGGANDGAAESDFSDLPAEELPY